MLKDLNIRRIEPDFIHAMIAQINGIDLSNSEDYFEKYETGVYRHDGFMFNFDGFIENNTSNEMIDKWVEYGVCDNYEQIIERNKELLADESKTYVIGLSSVKKSSQSPQGGWRWHKWGEYIGTQNPQHEYLYDEDDIDLVYSYHIYETK